MSHPQAQAQAQARVNGAGSNGPAAGNNPVSHLDVQAVLKKYKDLEAQGATIQNNPEFAKLVQILQVLSRQQQQQQQQQQQMKQQQQQQQQLKQQKEQAVASVAVNAMTPDQQGVLKMQINAFKFLSKGMPLPEALRHGILSPLSTGPLPAASLTSATPNQQAEVSADPTPAAHRIIEQTFKATLAEYDPKQQQHQPPSRPGLQIVPAPGKSDPYGFIPKSIPYSEHANRAQRMIIPAIMPTGIDPFELIESRERAIQTRIQERIKELENLPNNLANELVDPAHPVSSSGSSTETASTSASTPEKTSLKLKALIELKGLKLLDKQRKLREDIVKGMSKATTLVTSSDRANFRRVKKQTVRDAKQTEKIERQQRMDREKTEKEKHGRYVRSIVEHGSKLVTAQRQYTQRRQALGRAVAKYFAAAEKEEQKRLQKVQAERLRALKADDEEAYLKLLDKNKDKRIVHLLESTQKYLDSLTTAVMAQKEGVTAGDSLETIEDTYKTEGNALDGGAEDEDGSKVDYYRIAHRYREKVTQQSSYLIGGTLKDYQISGLEWLVSLYNNRLNGILADEMGLGKTIQTISLVTYLMEKKKQPGPFLVIVPLSTITNWINEFEKWAPGVVKVVYKGQPNTRKMIERTELRQGNFNVLLTTFEYIIKDRLVLSKIKWIYTIIDEGHRMKNANSKLSVTLTQFYHSRYRLILTGTPLQNNLPELWALLNFILPRIFNSVQSFDEWFNSPFSGMSAGNEKVDLNEEESLLIIKRLHKVLRPFLLRRLKKDVESELPDKVELVVKCRLSALQQRLYDYIREGKLLLADGAGRVKANSLNNKVMQLRKVCNHPFVFGEVEDSVNPLGTINDTIWRTSGKFELLDRIFPKLFATDHRVLMFFQMTNVMDIMEDYLRYKEFVFMRLDGSTKADERQAMLKDFNAPNSPYKIFLLSTRAGGLGLNLQTADTVIIFDSDWNPHQDLQAQDRAHRIGQTKEVRILRLITADSVEEKILQRAQYKLDMDGKVIQAGKFDQKTSAEEREAILRALFEAEEKEARAAANKEAGIANSGDEDDEDPILNDDELNEVLARSDEELKIFKKMDEQRRKEEIKEHGAKWTRLYSDPEVPAHYKHDLEDIYRRDEEENDVSGARRSRKSVYYGDVADDDRWAELIEKGLTPEEIRERRLKNIQKREQTKLRRLAGDAGDGDGDGDEEEGKESGSADASVEGGDGERSMRKRRGQGGVPENGDVAAMAVDNADGQQNHQNQQNQNQQGQEQQQQQQQDATAGVEEDKRKSRKSKKAAVPAGAAAGGTATPAAKPRKWKLYGVDTREKDTLAGNVRRSLNLVMDAVYKAVLEASNAQSEFCTEVFMLLPDRKTYPDYYELIKTPVCFEMIDTRMASNAFYKDLGQFRQDFATLFANAKYYNEDGSEIWNMADALEKAFVAKMEEMAPNGELKIVEEEVGVAEGNKRGKKRKAEEDALAAANGNHGEGEGESQGDNADSASHSGQSQLRIRINIGGEKKRKVDE